MDKMDLKIFHGENLEFNGIHALDEKLQTVWDWDWIELEERPGKWAIGREWELAVSSS